MKKILFIVAVFSIFSCSKTNNQSKAVTTTEEAPEIISETVDVYTDLYGQWRSDVMTAGVNITMKIGENGGFWMTMGDIAQEGTWEKIDNEYILVATSSAPNGQRWLVSNLSSKAVEICWNPDSDEPKTLLFYR